MQEDHSLEALINPGEAENFFDIANLPAFDPTATKEYSRTNALWLAEFCRLIYRQEKDELKSRPATFRTRNEFLSPRGWQQNPKDFFNLGSTQAALFTHADLNCAALVFRGTLGFKDLVTDANYALVRWLPEAGQVHLGFRDALEKVWSRMATRLAEFPQPIFYTGHSLGAALATLAVARVLVEGKLPKPAALYTFGSPRVGDETFIKKLQEVYHCRVVNDTDIVPTVPPPPLFRHDGELHHLRPDGRAAVQPRGTDSSDGAGHSFSRTTAAFKGLLAGLRTFKLHLPEQLTDHAPVNYTARLERAGNTL